MNKKELNKKTVSELKDIAKKNNVEKYSSMKKSEIIDKILKATKEISNKPVPSIPDVEEFKVKRSYTYEELLLLKAAELKIIAKKYKVGVRSKDKKRITIMKILTALELKLAKKSGEVSSTQEFRSIQMENRTERQKAILVAIEDRKKIVKEKIKKLKLKRKRFEKTNPTKVRGIKTQITKFETELSDLDFIVYEVQIKNSRKSYKVGSKSFVSPRIKEAKFEQRKAAKKMVSLDKEYIKKKQSGDEEGAMILRDEIKKFEKIYDAQNETLHATSASKSLSIKVRGMDAFYGPKQALFNVSIDFPRNEIIAIIGPSGCGKSTFLRTLNRINDEIPSFKFTGHVMFDGNIDIATKMNIDTGEKISIPEIRSRIGMVFQQPNPFPMSIYKNIAYGPKLNGEKNKATLNKVVESSLKQAALWKEVGGNLKKLGTALSGGQQQRLCIARAIANKPEVLLMDEPTSALDPIAAKKVEDTILELKKNYTIIMVTHSMAQAKRIADKVAFFYEGYLMEYGETKKIFNRPDKKKTAEYTSGKFG